MTEPSRSKLLSRLLLLRPNQWTKNALVLAAFIFALGDRQQAVSLASLWTVIEAALLFCLLSSGVYIVNDIRDVELDRSHPIKRRRPIAAGEVSVLEAGLTSIVLIVVGLAGCIWVSMDLFVVACGYVALQLAYSIWLKRVVLLDLFAIAAGFVLRAVAGAVVLKVLISPWLLLCTLLLALFLALCKRRHEKVVLTDLHAETRPSLASYNEQLLDQLIAIVSAATIVSYALYTLWPDTVKKFGTTHMGFTIPFVLFGLFRYLDLVYRHEQGDRPEKILLTDIPLIVDLVLYAVCVLIILL